MKNSNLIQVTLIGLLTLQISIANAAGFDCKNATTRVEKTICNSSDLSRLDEDMSKSYRRALSMVERYQVLEQQQKVWVQKREKCIDAICISKLTKQRQKQLNGMAIQAARKAGGNKIKPSGVQEATFCQRMRKMYLTDEIDKFMPGYVSSFSPDEPDRYVDIDIDMDGITDEVSHDCGGSGEVRECKTSYNLSSGGGGNVSGGVFFLMRYQARVYVVFRGEGEPGNYQLGALVRITPDGGLDAVCGEHTEYGDAQ